MSKPYCVECNYDFETKEELEAHNCKEEIAKDWAGKRKGSILT